MMKALGLRGHTKIHEGRSPVMSKIAKSANKIMNCYEYLWIMYYYYFFFISDFSLGLHFSTLHGLAVCKMYKIYRSFDMALIQRVRHTLTRTIMYCTCVRCWKIAWSLETHVSWEAFQRKFKIVCYWELDDEQKINE